MSQNLLEHFKSTRIQTEHLCAPLKTEDYSVQPMEDVSPPKWHLAHSSWFFEQFVLVPHHKGYKLFHEDYAFFFNSYYNNVGERVLRANRGIMTRPEVAEVYKYRKHVTDQMIEFFKTNPAKEVLEVIEIGINHEEQHQELLAYDEHDRIFRQTVENEEGATTYEFEYEIDDHGNWTSRTMIVDGDPFEKFKRTYVYK